VPKVIHKEPQKKKNLLKSSISELIQINIYKKGKEVEIVHKNVFTKKEIIISKLKIDEKEKKILLGSDFLNEEENRFTIVLKPIILNK